MGVEKAYLIASLTSPPAGEELESLSGQVDALEVRADLTGELDPAELRGRFSGELIYTLRSNAEGGAARDSEAERSARLTAAAGAFDMVDLEAERDWGPALLRSIPEEKRLVSWHGPASELDDLWRRFELMQTSPARLYKLIPFARRIQDSLLPLAFLKSVARADIVAFASGAAGEWTRLLAPRLGAPVVYGALGGEPAAPGQPSIARLRDDFGLPALPPVERVFGVAGNPVHQSLSPRVFNRMFRERGLPYAYLPFHVETFGDFWLDVVESGSLEVLGFELSGLSVTAPFKEIALAVAGAASPLAERVGSANTLSCRGGVWEAETTDPEGVIAPLATRGVRLAGLRTAVVGSGGAGRAAAFGLAREGARVTLANRGAERGRRVAVELGVDFTPLAELDPGVFGLLVNATPLGRTSDGEAPFEPSRMRQGATLVDLGYLPDGPTWLVRRAREAGLAAVDGREVLLAQAIPQSLTMTGEQLPVESTREALGLHGD